jgi:two-component sensor histidine kinase
MQQALMHIENRIMSISHLYSLLYTKHDIGYIHAEEYFSLLIGHIQTTLHKEDICITFNTDVSLDSETAVYCGFIINEAVTNSLQHAFEPGVKGNISIALMKYKKTNILIIEDDGAGFDTSMSHESLGLVIIESLATYQLHGSLSIASKKGTKIEITWEDRDA